MKNNFRLSTQPRWKEEEDVVVLEQDVDLRSIILFNDNVNTFGYVIEMLIRYCKHEAVQAEQCTYLVHYTGKCEVKRGSYDELEPVCTQLLEAGLTAEIQ
ncbi:MAG TPA: Clp protease ClpS [Flavobacteriales bacterium]|nr:Clp protease ClpS [Flavobacteriales bacterium]HRE74870.1 ATP-dependent Clp protease adaptor ClpS [Flavobacteriales bacterium]HRE97469.1 ATP-dependent Clp protease adaptor ClpS [Flavobacteriales bacterium]HRJ34760.1 ATP-dependent Clp protease adaptor ClpS [Flavobacteriales bacterium]HRJ37906.1 ATP-dependent Clp protease adaptor ClpS [Flavobacteriales bacterium]